MTFVDRPGSWPMLFASTVLIGLFIDQAFAQTGQQVVNVAVCVIFAGLLLSSPAEERALFALCLLIAFFGEFFLCKIAGAYRYRDGNLPIFVIPGHVLLYATGLWLAKRAHDRLYLWLLLLFVPYALLAWVFDFDRLSVLLFGLFALMLWLAPLRKLFSVMFLLALAMEIYGTWMGNWVWAETLPFGFGEISQANPPFGSGVFYCGLDYLTQKAAKILKSHVLARLGFHFKPFLMAWTRGTK